MWDVTLEGDLWVGPAPITQDQFSALMGYEPSSERGIGLPVTSVTWHQAAAFTNALSAHEGLEACYRCEGEGPGVRCQAGTAPYACEGYRLPTEAEWEYGARGGLEDQSFPNGGGLAPSDALNCAGPVVLSNGRRLGEQAWHCGLGGGVQPVVQLEPNGYGLYDMSGNTWEWCHDWYAPYAGDATDPWGPEQGDKRVARGGSAKLYYPQHLRVAFRLAVDPATPAPQLGFRVVKAARRSPVSGGR